MNITDSGPLVSASDHIWQTAPNKIEFTFNRPLTGLDAGDFTVIDVNTNLPVTVAGFSYVAPTATLTFPGVLPDGEYRATVLAAGFTDAQGNPMQANHVFDFFLLTATPTTTAM